MAMNKSYSNRLLTAVLLSAFSMLLFSQQAYANRPAAEEEPAMEASAEPVTSTEKTVMHEQQSTPSSVEIMMQQQKNTEQQTGDVVMLPPKEIKAGETVSIQLLDFPRRGMSMDKVKNEYGQPNTVSNSIGKPPITSWIYGDRIVYFEYSTVLHVVAR